MYGCLCTIACFFVLFFFWRTVQQDGDEVFPKHFKILVPLAAAHFCFFDTLTGHHHHHHQQQQQHLHPHCLHSSLSSRAPGELPTDSDGRPGELTISSVEPGTAV